MTKPQLTPPQGILVAIDIGKTRNEVLIEIPGHARRRRLTVLNTRASLFGRLKSTAFRFSDTKAATAPRALASLRIWHNGPSFMGSEERGGTI